ncbi:helix-turn-helix domain-containing protein [Paenibacillus sp. JSM ZJ436]|uniref:AraC family transcriptional regulator n=1 Tax=Paenibacillus sp. JSM ZJ436 TaxID=3376190 RepID=UPI0037B608D4
MNVKGPTLQHPKPAVRQMLQSDTEYRLELPYGTESLIYYIGINHKQNWHTAVHSHDHYELCYVVRGSSSYIIDNTLYRMDRGEFLITKPGEAHYGLAEEQSPFTLYYLGFKPSLLPALQRELIHLGPGRVAKDATGSMRALFEQLFTEMKEPQLLDREMTGALLQQLLIILLRLCRNPDPATGISQPGPLHPAVIQTLDYLHAEIRYDHSPEELATQFNISRSHLSREFRQAAGMPLASYIRLLCLDKARHELLHSTKPVTEIAEELCFSSIHTFSIFFKRFTGLSPSEFRRKQGST